MIKFCPVEQKQGQIVHKKIFKLAFSEDYYSKCKYLCVNPDYPLLHLRLIDLRVICFQQLKLLIQKSIDHSRIILSSQSIFQSQSQSLSFFSFVYLYFSLRYSQREGCCITTNSHASNKYYQYKRVGKN